MDSRHTEEQADLLALQKFQHNFENSLKSSIIYLLRDGALTIGELEQRIDQSHGQILEQLQELIEDGLVRPANVRESARTCLLFNGTG